MLSSGLTVANGLVHHHPGDGLPILFLFWRVETMSFQIHGDGVDGVLYSKVFELPIVIGVVLVKHRDCPVVTSDVDALKSGIELNDIRTAR